MINQPNRQNLSSRYPKKLSRDVFLAVHFMMISRLLLCLTCVSVLGSSRQVWADQWTKEVAQAIKTAETDGKNILFYFSGTDQCENCKRLETEVFEREEFQNEISSEYGLVRVVHPNTPDATQAELLQSQKWSKQYGVTRYPTVVLVDQHLKPFAITGYEAGGINNYLGLLAEFHKVRVDRDDALGKASKVQGLDRAQLLDRALSGIDQEIAEVYYPKIIEEIIALDPNNELGLRSKWNAERESELRKVMMTELLLVARLEKPAAAIEAIDKAMGEIEFPPQQQLEILQIKLNIVRRQNDPEALDDLLDQMIELPGVEGSTRERLITKKILLMRGSGRKDAAMRLMKQAIEEGQKRGSRNVVLWLSMGETLMSDKKYEDAINAFDQAIPVARDTPDALADLISGKADAFYYLDQPTEALKTLDNFSEDTNLPSDLRAEATLHKSILMRKMGKTRLARLSENRAIEIAKTPKLKSAFQKVVDQLRAKYDSSNSTN